MFADADLFGIPVRVVISPKTCERGVAEVTLRDKSYREDIPLENAAKAVKALVERLLEQYRI